MASSSNGATHAEKDLAAHFRRVYVHLRHSSRREELDYLIDKFAETLDLPDSQLHRFLYPHCLPLHERANFQAEIEVLEQLRRVSRSMKPADRIFEASNACGDMGWLLRRVGRKDEGEQWCEFDRLLTVIAWKVEEEEQNAASLRADEERASARSRTQAQARVRRDEVIELD